MITYKAVLCHYSDVPSCTTSSESTLLLIANGFISSYIDFAVSTSVIHMKWKLGVSVLQNNKYISIFTSGNFVSTCLCFVTQYFSCQQSKKCCCREKTEILNNSSLDSSYKQMTFPHLSILQI